MKTSPGVLKALLFVALLVPCGFVASSLFSGSAIEEGTPVARKGPRGSSPDRTEPAILEDQHSEPSSEAGRIPVSTVSVQVPQEEAPTQSPADIGSRALQQELLLQKLDRYQHIGDGDPHIRRVHAHQLAIACSVSILDVRGQFMEMGTDRISLKPDNDGEIRASRGQRLYTIRFEDFPIVKELAPLVVDLNSQEAVPAGPISKTQEGALLALYEQALRTLDAH